MTATESIAALRGALEAGPTPGPWQVGFWDGSGPTYITDGVEHDGANQRPNVIVSGNEDSWSLPQGVTRIEDAEFIAAANPEAIRAILDERDSLLARIETLEADAARLEFLIDTGPFEWRPPELINVPRHNARAAIDAARKAPHV